jgi:RNA 2',3'-cyclic 3'-phosphodiesterase
VTRSAGPGMRMFTALVPPPEVVEHLDDFLAPRREHADFRWTVPESWHVTLGFMPRVPERVLEDLEDRLARAAQRGRPFTLRLEGGGAFPDAAAARALYAAVSASTEDAAGLHLLSARARAAAARAGAEVDGGRFRPHLTLARLRRPADVVRWLRLLDGYSSPPWSVTELVLVHSHLGEGPRGRPRHEVVTRLRLGPA